MLLDEAKNIDWLWMTLGKVDGMVIKVVMGVRAYLKNAGYQFLLVTFKDFIME